MITKHVCEICDRVVGDDYIIYDEELTTFFCRDDYDKLMNQWNLEELL